MVELFPAEERYAGRNQSGKAIGLRLLSLAEQPSTERPMLASAMRSRSARSRSSNGLGRQQASHDEVRCSRVMSMTRFVVCAVCILKSRSMR